MEYDTNSTQLHNSGKLVFYLWISMETAKHNNINTANMISPGAEVEADLAKATALLCDLIDDNPVSRESETILLEQAQITTNRPEITGQIETQDLEKFISQIYDAQREREKSQFLAAFKQSRESLEEPVATSFSAQSIYDSLQRYGIEVDSEVFNQVIERNNSRERVQARKRNIAEELGLPANATIQQIKIETKIRKHVDELIARLPDLIEEGLTKPETLLVKGNVDGFLNFRDRKEEDETLVVFRTLDHLNLLDKPCVKFELGDRAVAVDILEEHSKKEMAVEQLSPFQRLGRALGLFQKPEKDEEHNHTLRSPAIKDLVKKIEELGVIAEIYYGEEYGTAYSNLNYFLRNYNFHSLYLHLYIRI
jgi:hypothetical protein